MHVNALLIHPMDNVVTVTEAVKKGGTIAYYCEGKVEEIVAAQDIPEYHKAARREIAAEETVYKYGEAMATAVVLLEKGIHVHDHNVTSTTKL